MQHSFQNAAQRIENELISEIDVHATKKAYKKFLYQCAAINAKHPGVFNTHHVRIRFERIKALYFAKILQARQD